MYDFGRESFVDEYFTGLINYLTHTGQHQLPYIKLGGYNISYINDTDYSQSALGEGGYVFEFDRKSLKDNSTGLIASAVLLLPWNQEYQVARIVIETAMYNANFDLFTYAAQEFDVQT
jgi:hypothetical protein